MQMNTRMALGIAALLLTVTPSIACRDSKWGSVTVWNTLPAGAELEQVVARVEVIELLKPSWVTTDDWKSTHRIRVRVVDAIKGVQQGQTFIVETRGTSCDDTFPHNEPKFETYRINWRPYVAGQFIRGDTGEAVFQGAWITNPATGKAVPPSLSAESVNSSIWCPSIRGAFSA
jgi:hypothetical protein